MSCAQPLTIRSVVEEPDSLQEALELLCRRLPPEQRLAAQAEAMLRLADHRALGQGLFTARRAGQLVGAIWLAVEPGCYATVTGPQLLDSEEEATADRLLAAALEYAASQPVRIAQALLPANAGGGAEQVLRRSGFSHAADLLYMVSVESSFPEHQPRGDWSYRRYRADEADANEELIRVVKETYVGSLDCPAADQLRTPAEAIAGYQATGASGTEHWFLIDYRGETVGCLLLADHADLNQMELVYLGVAPRARGRGLGTQLSRLAQWTARQLGRERLVLAVDVSNTPAVAAYLAAGFVIWDQRRVFLKAVSGRNVEN